MGQRGPLPKRTGARAIDAERNPKPLPGDETGFDLRPPEGLEPATEREFMRLRAMLLRPPLVLTERDGDALADLALCLVRLRSAEAEIAARGVLVNTPQGPRRNPACMVAATYRQSLQTWSAKFGLTPDARARMALPVPNEADDDPHGLLD